MGLRIFTGILLVSFLSVWAEDKERSEKSLRGVFPFREVQQHNGNSQNPHLIHRQNLQDSNIHPNLHGSHDESQNSRRPKTQAHHVHHPQDAFHIEKGAKPNLNEYYYEDDHLIGEKSDEDSIGEIFPSRESRQGGGDQEGFGEDIFIDLGAVAAAGERCIDKVVMVEETRYDDVIECKHSYSERCHTTYITDFQPQQEEVCEENFVKSCFIEYKNIASDETVKFCHTPLECVGEGPIECKTVYESECQTNYHEHNVEDDVVNCVTIQEEKCEDVTQGYSTERKCTKWPVRKCDNIEKKNVKKYSPETNCKKVPRQLCGPSGCELSPGPEFCFDKQETVVQEVPEETCHLEPQRSCKHVTKLVPVLKPTEECVDIPKEVCSRSRINPRKERIPVLKKWCYIPTPESGLIAETEEYS